MPKRRTLVAHELGHAAGLLHADGGVMDDSLRAGQRSMPQSRHDAQGSALAGAATGASAAPALAIDWSVHVPLARPRDAGAVDARLGDQGWRQRFVNHMGASREAVDPNAALRLHIPVASQAAPRMMAR